MHRDSEVWNPIVNQSINQNEIFYHFLLHPKDILIKNSYSPLLVQNLNDSWLHTISGVPRGGWGVHIPPPPEILKALQNRAKLNPIVKTVKNC